MDIIPSPLESHRFGMNIGRLLLPAGEIPSRPIEGIADFDLVVAILPTDAVLHPDVLGSDRIEVDVMDTRMTWQGPVRDARAPSDLRQVESWGHPDDELVREVFAGYRNHMSRRTGTSSEEVAAGYAEWAHSHLGRADAACLTIGDHRPTGIAAVTLRTTEREVVVDLAGIRPAVRGRGEYSRLLDAVEAWGAGRGAHSVVISTQADNIAVQRAWARRGWLPSRSDWVVHLRPRDVS